MSKNDDELIEFIGEVTDGAYNLPCSLGRGPKPQVLDDLRRVLFFNRVECRREKELNDFQRNPLDIEILSNLRFGSLEIRDTSVTRVTNNFYCSWKTG
jgi:hypothetical protein